MTAIEFHVAAKASTVGEDEDVVEVPLDGKVYLARRLTVAQAALLPLALGGGTTTGRLSAAFQIIEAFIGVEGAAHVRRLVWERRLDYADLLGGGSADNPEGGLIDLIIGAFSERPTQPSTASSSSRQSGGRRSTGRSRGPGSIPSDSPSTGS